MVTCKKNVSSGRGNENYGKSYVESEKLQRQIYFKGEKKKTVEDKKRSWKNTSKSWAVENNC